MKYVSLKQSQNIFTLYLEHPDGQNVFNFNSLDEWNRALDDVESYQGDSALIITSNHHKNFCIGIDIDTIFPLPNNELQKFIIEFENLLLRIATLNIATICAINGNCYAGGAILAAACNYRYMRKDKGRFCYPETKLKKAFTPIMNQVVQLLPNRQSAYNLSLTAEAWGGEQCAKNNIIDSAVSIDDLASIAELKAKDLSQVDRKTITTIKRNFRQNITDIAIERGVI